MSAGRVILIIAMFLTTLFPWLVRNHKHYARYKLTAQAIEHLLQYIVPFVWQYSKGIPFIEGMKKANAAFEVKVKEEGIDAEKLSPFEKSDLQAKMALDILKDEPKKAL